MSTTLEPPPTPSPRGKLSKLSRRGRKDKDAETSSLSLVSNSTEGDQDGTDRKSSVDGFIDKLKERSRRSTDDRRSSADNGSGNRMSKLLPGKLKTRRSSNTTTDDSRRSSADRDQSPATSQRSLEHNGSGRSSLLTDDSDTERYVETPPITAFTLLLDGCTALAS